jgi:hypothetical protein
MMSKKFKDYLLYLAVIGEVSHLPMKDIREIAELMERAYEDGYSKGLTDSHNSSESVINEIAKQMKINMRANLSL